MSHLKFSIVTPSFNQSNFLERTIQSVIGQEYSNLEYIIVDGGSKDGSVEIIKKYEPHLTYWVSEKDGGQTEAINKGLKKITGDIWAYICSDDTYTPNAFKMCLDVFKKTHADVVYGNCSFVNADDVVTREKKPGEFNRDRLLKGNYIYQPSVFMKKWILDEFGPFDESLHYSMDYEYWVRVSQKAKFKYVDFTFSNYRLHKQSKSMHAVTGMNEEGRAVKKRYGVGFAADWSYYNFMIWGKHYYNFKRFVFDRIAK